MSYGPEEGDDHTCPDCGAKWWDSDGGCSCTKCRHCGKVGDEDFAPDGYCADCLELVEGQGLTIAGWQK